ncbi:MAG: VTT domain-containing protein [Promethearchaeota archaeon]
MDETDKKRKLSGPDIFLIVFFVLITVVAFLSWQNPDIGAKLSIENWFKTDSSLISFWAAIGFTMLACFLGALIPIPIPYMIPVSTFSFSWLNEGLPNAWLLIIVLVIAASVANTIGDMLDYFIGIGSEKVVERDDPELQNRWAKLILKKPKLIPWLVTLFAVTPLPDSLLLVPLGFIKYPARKTIFAMFIGKIVMMGSMAVAGIFGIQWLLDLVSGEGSWVSGVVLLYLMWLMILVMVKINPEKKEEE